MLAAHTASGISGEYSYRLYILDGWMDGWMDGWVGGWVGEGLKGGKDRGRGVKSGRDGGIMDTLKRMGRD